MLKQLVILVFIIQLLVLSVSNGFQYPLPNYISGLMNEMNKLYSQSHNPLLAEEIRRFGYYKLFPNDIINLLPEYDFIIVGSGPAGCVLANRLSERHDWTVLLLEAGEEETFFHRIPMLAGYLSQTSSNWNYKAVKNESFCWGMEGQTCNQPRGKIIGGTSAINYMIYNRGHPRDFNRWADEGNIGWSYEEVLPYFRKSERALLRGREKTRFHGTNGTLGVQYTGYSSPLVHAFVEGSKQIGHRAPYDYHADTGSLGVSYVQSTTKFGVRSSAGSAFLDPSVRARPNLHIVTGARVTKVLINKQTKVAYGVQYAKFKRYHKVKARKEVILSAGAFNSPQLLMLSGIGPKDDLQKHRIPVIKDLPVGQVLYDHVSHYGPVFVLNTTSYSINQDRIGIIDIAEYFKNRGVLTSIGGVEALNFIKTENSRDPPDYPDAEIIFASGTYASDKGDGIRRSSGVSDYIYREVYKPLESLAIDAFSVFVMHFHPKSFGRVTLQDKNPFHWPLIYPNYFSDPDDAETILHGIKTAIRISQTPALQKFGARLHDIPLPNCKHLPFASDDYWRCSIRTLSCTLHHQVGTCKMGPSYDKTAVVDPQLRVYGIKRLRVADCSVAPRPPTAHTNAMSFMIGEKAADMIKSDWK